MYKEYNSEDLWGERPAGNRVDQWYQRLLFDAFSESTAKKIYGVTIDTIAFFLKVGVYLTLPFKFLQFFRQSWKDQNPKNQPK